MIATSIEQSKKLLELGLDPDTADMFYNGEIETPYPLIYKDNTYYLPAWSLNSLMMLMPSYVGDWDEGVDLTIYPTLNKTRKWVFRYEPYEKEKSKIKKRIFGDTPIDSAYEIICWLLENGYIKTSCEKCKYNVTECMNIECYNKPKK